MRIQKISKKRAFELVKKMNIITYGDSKHGSTSLLNVKIQRKPDYSCAIYENGQPIGWGIKFNSECHIYVHPNYRRKGVGAKILNKLDKETKNAMYCPWDERSRSFFESQKAKIHPDFK